MGEQLVQGYLREFVDYDTRNQRRLGWRKYQYDSLVEDRVGHIGIRDQKKGRMRRRARFRRHSLSGMNRASDQDPPTKEGRQPKAADDAFASAGAPDGFRYI
jgi:hypothetical protein